MEFLKKMNKKEGKTIIMVTHDDELSQYADRIEYLKDGEIIKKTTFFLSGRRGSFKLW